MTSRFVEPPHSKRAVNRSGSNIADGTYNQSDIELVDQWRASHAYVLNTFQIFFKRRIKEFNTQIEFAQRLKRRNTIIDKLLRRNTKGEKLISDVTTMQDFAGCRLIFPDMESLNGFREFLHSSKKMKSVLHILKHANETEKFNYVDNPKWTGYRGIHEIFIHRPRLHRKDKDNAKPWRNLLCEVQYRTRIQNAWATALEISDLIDNERTKFALIEDKVPPRVEFFQLISELLARFHENSTNALPDLTIEQIRAQINDLEGQLGILRRLSAIKVTKNYTALKRHNVLNIYLDKNKGIKLKVLVFKNAIDAIKKSQELESSKESLNAVYVASNQPNELRRAYKNYFNDPVDFVELVNEALRE